jgi:hypothetical protein
MAATPRRRVILFLGSALLAWCAPSRPLLAADRGAAPRPFMVGLNYPWVKYGLDFGVSGFGRFGLSTDCAQGFRPETFPGSDGVVGCQRSQDVSHQGSHSLQVFFDLAGEEAPAGPPRPANGEVTTDLQDVAEAPRGFSVDLDGGSVSAWVYVAAGLEGDASRPNFFQLFVKDAAEKAPGLYSPAFNVPAAGGWTRLRLDVRRDPASSFDPSRVRLVGVKIGIGGGSAVRMSGSFYLDQIESTAPAVSFDLEQPSRAEADAIRFQAAGVRTLRWFVFTDGRASLQFDAAGGVTGLDPSFFRDFDVMLALARDHGFKVVPVLFDFLLCGDRQEMNGVQLFGHADLIRDRAKLRSLLSQALGPLIDRYAGAPEIAAWEIMNEPEWCVSDVPLASRPPELPPSGAVSLREMRFFVHRIAAFIQRRSGGGSAPVTLGTASGRFLALWNDLGLDLCELHLYNCQGCLDEGRALPPAGSCLLGEFAARAAVTDRTVLQYLNDTCSGGYAGALAWSWRAGDFASPSGTRQHQRLLAQIRQFTAAGDCGAIAP